MNIDFIRQKAAPGDIILKSVKGTKGINHMLDYLIGYGQKCFTKNGEPSIYGHALLYIDTQTIAESTMDFKPYDHAGRTLRRAPRGCGKRLQNGPQYNSLLELREPEEGLLLHFDLTDRQREDILTAADTIIRLGVKYSILGLFGSMMSYWITRSKCNPLSFRHTLYCSAFVQACYAVKNVDISFDEGRAYDNVCPEMIARYASPQVTKSVV